MGKSLAVSEHQSPPTIKWGKSPWLAPRSLGAGPLCQTIPGGAIPILIHVMGDPCNYCSAQHKQLEEAGLMSSQGEVWARRSFACHESKGVLE